MGEISSGGVVSTMCTGTIVEIILVLNSSKTSYIYVCVMINILTVKAYITAKICISATFKYAVSIYWQY